MQGRRTDDGSRPPVVLVHDATTPAEGHVAAVSRYRMTATLAARRELLGGKTLNLLSRWPRRAGRSTSRKGSDARSRRSDVDGSVRRTISYPDQLDQPLEYARLYIEVAGWVQEV
jgi:hypothetical protein